jgi:hypothetical protein
MAKIYFGINFKVLKEIHEFDANSVDSKPRNSILNVDLLTNNRLTESISNENDLNSSINSLNSSKKHPKL